MKILAAFILLLAAAWGRSHTTSGAHAPSDPDYVAALATANRFLHAWQTGDLAEGMVLVSDGVRRSHTPEKLEQFFLAETGRAFEIGSGQRKHRRYTFPVVLITLMETGGASTASTNAASARPTVARRSSTIVVSSAGKDDWVVDKLP